MIKVKSSNIHGRGLFSTAKIKQGTVIGTCKVTDTRELNPYTLWVGDKTLDVTCDFKFINHSLKPNVSYFDDLTIVALRDIEAGEELTHQYE